MLAIIKRSLDPKNEPHWFWGIALLALFIEVVFHTLLPVSISNDTYGYLYLSQHLGTTSASFERSLGYPAFLALLGTELLDSFVPVILAQAAMAVSIPLIIYKSMIRFGLGYAVLGAMIACVYFYNFVVSLYILTEPAYVFSIAVFTFFLIEYFQKPTTRNLLFVIASCWLIAMIRVSGSLHFLSLLAGIGYFILSNYIRRNPKVLKTGIRHLLIAIAVFASISLFHHIITNRTSSVVWPHFVFNWVYKSNPDSKISHGIIKPENGPAAQKLFEEIEKIVAADPAAFNTLKAGGTEKIKALKAEKNGKYSQKSVALLMDDLINNNRHDLRSWWIEDILKNGGHGVVGTSELLGNAILEAFRKHPEVIVQRMSIVFKDRIWNYIVNGVDVNIVSFPTAYYHQIPKDLDAAPSGSLRPGIYKQWTYDLFQHTGNDPVNREIYHPLTYPKDLSGASANIQSDNLIGFGHYVGLMGTQSIRICWLLIMVGFLIFPFTNNPSLLVSLLCASTIPPIASVFMSETDPRHLLMTSPVHFATAVFVIYSVMVMFKKSKPHGENHAR